MHIWPRTASFDAVPKQAGHAQSTGEGAARMSTEGAPTTSNLVVITYPDEHRAAVVIAMLERMSKQYLIDMEDACYVTKGQDGRLQLHQTKVYTGAGAAWGGLWGLLIGLLFLAPIAGLVTGAAVGAFIGKLPDFGIDEDFAKRLTANMSPGSSAVFVLVRTVTPDKVVPELARFGGTVMQTTLPKETEAKLQQALNEGMGEQVAQELTAAEAQLLTAPRTPNTTPIVYPTFEATASHHEDSGV
jgi:uncharacterized membrane protein